MIYKHRREFILKDVQIFKTNSLMVPDAASLLQSPIGVIGLYQFGVSMIFLIVFMFVHLKEVNLTGLWKRIYAALNIKQ